MKFFLSVLDPHPIWRIIFLMKNNPDQPLPMQRLAWLAVFAIAMGMLEAIVVVYLRELYFPGGFRFPLQAIPEQMLRVEVFREICTIVMLATVAALSARTFMIRFSLFLFVFGVWDIFYYVFLKVLLNWPESLFTWDVLFLIPVTWLGPVLAPLICSLTMIALSLVIVFLHREQVHVRFGTVSCFFLLAGAFMIFLSFTLDYASLVRSQDLGNSNAAAIQEITAAYVPTSFRWKIFLSGEALLLASGITLYRKSRESTKGIRE